jgi:hypothetical protein
MHVLPAIGFKCSLLLLVAAIGVAPGTARAQQIQIELLGGPRQFELTPPQVDTVSGTTQARLEQARALAADGKWQEVVDALRELASDRTDRVVAVGDGQYVSLCTYCQLEISHLPPEALALYRAQVDPAAERWYREGLVSRDPELLRRVVDEAFCSSWGDDALWALGELSLEQADYGAARRAWEQMSPLTRDPTGKPMWLALREVDLDAHWPEVQRRWLDRAEPPNWLAYPDTDFKLADVRARLILVSIREGDFDRAALELDVFRRLHPDATGRLAGEDGPYVAALEHLLAAARKWPDKAHSDDWTTFAGRPTRNGAVPRVGQIAGSVWRDPIRLDRSDWPGRTQKARGAPADAVVRETQRPLSFYPLVIGNLVLYNTAREIHAADLATGEPAMTLDGVLYRAELFANAGGQSLVERADLVASGVPRYTMTVVDGVLYARVGSIVTGRLQPGPSPTYERLVGLDLRREGLLVFQVRPDDENWSFDGAPVSDGRRVFVAMRRSDVAPRSYVACFDAATGKRLWRTAIAAADTPASGRGDEITHNLLTLAGDRLYLNTNLGLVAAVSADDGQVCWLRRYERAAGTQTAPGALHFDRDPSPCVYWRGTLLVAPSDTPSLFALDADTGGPLWATDRLADVTGLLGVAEGNLIAGGNRLWSVDARSGHVAFVWPESEHAGIRGIGRGLVAGREVFWPARREVYVLDVGTGQPTRRPIELAPVGKTGANLVAAHGGILAAGFDRMCLLGPPLPPPDDKTTDEGLALYRRPVGSRLLQTSTSNQPLTTNY